MWSFVDVNPVTSSVSWLIQDEYRAEMRSQNILWTRKQFGTKNVAQGDVPLTWLPEQ